MNFKKLKDIKKNFDKNFEDHQFIKYEKYFFYFLGILSPFIFIGNPFVRGDIESIESSFLHLQTDKELENSLYWYTIGFISKSDMSPDICFTEDSEYNGAIGKKFTEIVGNKIAEYDFDSESIEGSVVAEQMILSMAAMDSFQTCADEEILNENL
jgi:hypothetical protein